MKIFSGFLIPLFIFISCQNNDDSSLVEDGDILTGDVADTCYCDDLEIDSLGMYLNEDKNYTGICISNYPGTDYKYIEKSLLEGKLHGKVIYYDKEGNILIEEIYESGVVKLSGGSDVLECDCGELMQMKASDPNIPVRFSLDDIPYTGSCKSYFEESEQIYLEANYKNGLLHGYTIYYKQDGSRLYMEKYINGTLENTVY